MRNPKSGGLTWTPGPRLTPFLIFRCPVGASIPHCRDDRQFETYFHGKQRNFITGILALIAFTPIDNPWHPYWYNDTVYLFKNPNSEGFWPHDVQFETSRNGRGCTFHYTFNGILAGWNWVEFVLYGVDLDNKSLQGLKIRKRNSEC